MPPDLQDMKQTPKPAFLFQTKDERFVVSEHTIESCMNMWWHCQNQLMPFFFFKLSIVFIEKNTTGF